MQDGERIQARRFYLAALRHAQKEPADYETAAELLLKASKLRSAEADYALATWFLFGRHFKKDIKRATVLLKRSQRAGNPDACYDLAVSYDKGIGVPKDRARAFELYLEGAMRGDLLSYEQVARCFSNGSGVKKNRVLADLWGKEYERLKLRASRRRKSKLGE